MLGIDLVVCFACLPVDVVDLLLFAIRGILCWLVCFFADSFVCCLFVYLFACFLACLFICVFVCVYLVCNMLLVFELFVIV